MLSPHPTLLRTRRTPGFLASDSAWAVDGETPTTTPGAALTRAEMATLLACGVLSALAVLLLDFRLRLPGHAILRSVFPMAVGLALVPRRGAGTVMGLGAAGAWLVWLAANGASPKGLGSTTSLLCTGPLLDLALSRARRGVGLYLAFMLAGVGSNLLALQVQASARGAGMGGGRSLGSWLATAAVTYPLFGVLAGLLSAAALFRVRDPSPRDDRPTGAVTSQRAKPE